MGHVRLPWQHDNGTDDVDWSTKVPKHNDICEVSMNICLGRDFSGGGVYFMDKLGYKESWVPKLVEHMPGTAFINLCQQHHGTFPITAGERHTIVIRVLSSEFRRAPAESFAERCLTAWP